MKQTLRNHPNANTYGILDPNFVYVPSHSSNILESFKQMGWVPPSIQKQTMRYDEYLIDTDLPF